MPQDLAVNDLVAVTSEGMNEGTPWAMTRHYRITAMADTDLFEDDLVAAYNTFFTALAVELTDKWNAECISLHRIWPKHRTVFYEAFAPAIVGDVTTDGVANDTALLVRLQTDDPGSRWQGRIYLPGLPEAATSGGLLLGAKQSDFDTIFAFFTSDITSTNGTARNVIFSKTTYDDAVVGPPGSFPPAPVTDYVSDITATAVQGNLASQRRRRYRRNAFG